MKEAEYVKVKIDANKIKVFETPQINPILDSG
jgi:hypothetical protein